MQPRRLKRLMRLIIELGSREFRSAEDIYLPLGISRSQFYRDKEELERMGFSFEFRRKSRAFEVAGDPGVKVEGLTLSEILALILAVGRLPETGDFTLAYRALTGLRKIAVDRPGPVADFIMSGIEEAARDGYGCDFELLEILVEAVEERRRIHVAYGRPDAARLRRFNLDPVALVFRGGRLYLETAGSAQTRQRLFRVSYLRDVTPTPFLSPD